MLPVIRRRGGNSTGLGFGEEFDRFFNSALAGSSLAWNPAVDVNELDEEFEVQAELPGLKPGDVSVTVENGVLSISGEKRTENEREDDSGRHISERRYGKFVRNFSLPRSVDGEGIEARFENGLLKIRLPKSSTAKARQIKIK